MADVGSYAFYGKLPTPIDPKDHPVNSVPPATEHYDGDQSNPYPEGGPRKQPKDHTDDPWNKSFGPDGR